MNNPDLRIYQVNNNLESELSPYLISKADYNGYSIRVYCGNPTLSRSIYERALDGEMTIVPAYGLILIIRPAFHIEQDIIRALSIRPMESIAFKIVEIMKKKNK